VIGSQTRPATPGCLSSTCLDVSQHATQGNPFSQQHDSRRRVCPLQGLRCTGNTSDV
jgi:hypothetical protein